MSRAERDENGRFRKGSAGNPAGRPRRSEIEKETLAQILLLAPKAVSCLQQLLEDETCPHGIRLRAAEAVLLRVCGKPMDLEALERLEDANEFEASLDSFLKTMRG